MKGTLHLCNESFKWKIHTFTAHRTFESDLNAVLDPRGKIPEIQMPLNVAQFANLPHTLVTVSPYIAFVLYQVSCCPIPNSSNDGAREDAGDSGWSRSLVVAEQY